MLRSKAKKLAATGPMYNTGNEWSGSVLFDFLGRLLVIIGLIAPPLVILGVVVYHATRP